MAKKYLVHDALKNVSNWPYEVEGQYEVTFYGDHQEENPNYPNFVAIELFVKGHEQGIPIGIDGSLLAKVSLDIDSSKRIKVGLVFDREDVAKSAIDGVTYEEQLYRAKTLEVIK